MNIVISLEKYNIPLILYCYNMSQRSLNLIGVCPDVEKGVLESLEQSPLSRYQNELLEQP